ncbi:MAG TPA: chain length determinant protein EpsF [Burkholderiales bacterium]|nr:chain length determinant protein EpsF [Burkholderiales bacterium]
MSFAPLLAILQARLRLMLLVLGVTVGSAVVVSLLMSPAYIATATVVVDAKSRDPVNGASLPQQLMETYVATQVDIITSPHVAAKVVDGLKLGQSEKIKETFLEETGGKGEIRDWLGQRLLEKLEVEPSHHSNAIHISFKANSPEQAAAVANAFAATYIDTNLELRIDPAQRVSDWYEMQIKQLREELEQTQGRLTAYQRERGLVGTDERLDVEMARLNELSTQLALAQSSTYDTASRHSATSSEVVNSNVVQQLRTELAKREAELAQMAQTFGHSHPTYKRTKADADSLRMRLNAEMGVAGSAVSSTATSAKQREESLRAAVERQKGHVLSLKQGRDEASLLVRDVENAQRVYDAALQRYGQARLEARANQTDIAILNTARPPVEPDSPRIVLNIALAVFLGGLLAVGLAFLLETLDRRVRAPEDVSDLLGIPVLGVLLPARPQLPQRRFALPKLR